MRRTTLTILVGTFLSCGSGTDAPVADSSSQAFLEGLSVTKEAPVLVKCGGGGMSFEISFVSAGSFGREYQGMRSALERNSDYALEDGMVFNGDLAQSCEVLHEGHVLETWSK